MSATVAIGVGCRLGCEAQVIEGLVRQALERFQAEWNLVCRSRSAGACAVNIGPRSPSARDSGEGRAVSKALTRLAPLADVGPLLAAQARDGRERTIINLPPNGASIGLFTIADKRDEVGLAEAAHRLGLALVLLPRAVLRDQAPFVQTCSPYSARRFDVPSVAEAAALAGAGPGAVLMVPRIARDGATCAIAGSPEHAA